MDAEMSKRCFVPIESYVLASPEIRMRGQHTDLGLLAEVLVLFEQVDMNITNAQNLADVLKGFLEFFGSINPFLDLLASGKVRVHYFDFISAPIQKDGVFSYWNIQDSVAEKSHFRSFQTKILYNPAIEKVLRKARHRQRLYDVVMKSVVIDGSEDYKKAILAAREASKSHEDIEFFLNAFKDSLPNTLRQLFPDKIIVTAQHDSEKEITKHHFNFDFNQLAPHLPNLNFKNHIPGIGLIQAHRILYASRRYDYDIYLPSPISHFVLAKLESLVAKDRKFAKTVVDLTEKACFPDIRSSYNEGQLGWKDILDIREKAARFQQWFASYGGKPDVALKSYGEEFQASTGLTRYRKKVFSIAKYSATVAGAAIAATVGGVAGVALGSMVGGLVPFAEELLDASEEEGWKPRFFGNWVHEKILCKDE